MFDTNAFIALGLSKHELVHRRYRVVLQLPLLHEIAAKFVVGEPNAMGLPAEQYVAKVIGKFQGRYVFMSIAETLRSRELRGEKLRLNGEPYTQDHFDAFNPLGDPIRLMAVNKSGQRIPQPVYWMNRVLHGKTARDPNIEPTPPSRPFDAAHYLRDAAGLLEDVGHPSSNAELLSRVRAVLRDQRNALTLLRYTTTASTPISNTPACVRLRHDALVSWLRARSPGFWAYPFAMHCAEVAFLYFAGVRCGKPREPDNDPGDLAHLYMLPFVSVVVSDDRLVRTIASLLARPDQRVLTKDELLAEIS